MLVPSTVYLFNISIQRRGIAEILAQCQERADTGQGASYIFTNVHLLVEASKKPRVKEALQNSSFCLCDGKPLYWAAKLKGLPITSRSPGPDFMPALLKLSPNKHHGFIGGHPGQAEEIARNFKLPHFTALVPPFRKYSLSSALDDWTQFLDLCPDNKTPPYVWVALGAPKQELWIQTISPMEPQTQFFAIGAAFDFLSGTKNRAPRFMQEIGLEWFYRLCSEPRRLFWRYVSTNSYFIFRMFFEILRDRLHRRSSNDS